MKIKCDKQQSQTSWLHQDQRKQDKDSLSRSSDLLEQGGRCRIHLCTSAKAQKPSKAGLGHYSKDSPYQEKAVKILTPEKIRTLIQS